MDKLIPLPLYARIQRATMKCGHTFPATESSSIWQLCPHCGNEGLVIRWEVVRD